MKNYWAWLTVFLLVMLITGELWRVPRDIPFVNLAAGWILLMVVIHSKPNHED